MLGPREGLLHKALQSKGLCAQTSATGARGSAGTKTATSKDTDTNPYQAQGIGCTGAIPIAHFSEAREFADGSRLVEQLNSHPAGMAPLRDVPGSL